MIIIKMVLLNIITLPGDFASSTLGYVGQIFSDLSGLILLIVGVLLGVVVIELILGAIRRH